MEPSFLQKSAAACQYIFCTFSKFRSEISICGIPRECRRYAHCRRQPFRLRQTSRRVGQIASLRIKRWKVERLRLRQARGLLHGCATLLRPTHRRRGTREFISRVPALNSATPADDGVEAASVSVFASQPSASGWLLEWVLPSVLLLPSQSVLSASSSRRSTGRRRQTEPGAPHTS